MVRSDRGGLDSKLRPANGRRLHVSAPSLLGIGTFVSGFCVLGLWWDNTANAAMPGWSAYRTAVLGDGLCLPVLVGVLAADAASLKPARWDAVVTAAGGALGVAVGVTIQFAWLYSDTTRLNWTIPRQHHFNAAGWYHAAFFVAVLAVVVALTARIACRVRRTQVTGPNLALLTTATMGFGLLQTLDTLRPTFQANHDGAVASLVGTAGLTILLLAVMQWPGVLASPRRSMQAVAAGSLAAISMAFVAEPLPQDLPSRFLAASLILMSLAVMERLLNLRRSPPRNQPPALAPQE